MVGFGAAERALREAEAGARGGDLEPLRELRRHGRGLEGGEDGAFDFLSAFLDDAPAGYAELARAAAGSVRFAGRLEHDEVATPVACSEALVFPSTFPEAFGMVAAEAAATGALPVSAAHSGAAEVSPALAADLPEPALGLVSFDLGRRRGRGDRRAARRLARARARRARGGRAPCCARPSSASGAGRGSRARCSTRPPARLDELPRPVGD